MTGRLYSACVGAAPVGFAEALDEKRRLKVCKKVKVSRKKVDEESSPQRQKMSIIVLTVTMYKQQRVSYANYSHHWAAFITYSADKGLRVKELLHHES